MNSNHLSDDTDDFFIDTFIDTFPDYEEVDDGEEEEDNDDSAAEEKRYIEKLNWLDNELKSLRKDMDESKKKLNELQTDTLPKLSVACEKFLTTHLPMITQTSLPENTNNNEQRGISSNQTSAGSDSNRFGFRNVGSAWSGTKTGEGETGDRKVREKEEKGPRVPEGFGGGRDCIYYFGDFKR